MSEDQPIFVRPIGQRPDSPSPVLPTHVLSVSTKLELGDEEILGPAELSQFADSIESLWQHSGNIRNRPDQPVSRLTLRETQVMAMMTLIRELASVYSGTRLEQVANEIIRCLVQMRAGQFRE